MLDLQQLTYFVAVAEEEHVGRAAERLSLSPSPLSRQVRALESRIGGSLFDRSGNRLKLTAAGRELLGEARALLERAAQVEQRATDIAAGRSGTLRVGYVEGALHTEILPGALQRFSTDRPGVRLELALLRTAQQLDGLAAGTLDLAVTYAPPAADSGLASELVLDEPLVLALPAGHPLATGPLTTAAIDSAAWISPPRARRPSQAAPGGASTAERPARDVRFEAAEPTAVLALVAAGLGIAAVQESIAMRGTGGVVFRPFPGTAERVRLHVCQQPAAGRAVQRLAELIRTSAAVGAGDGELAARPTGNG